jgi:hypothetical protein
MRTKQTIIIFRKWKPEYGSGIIALFPKEFADYKGLYCDSYEQIGQHGAASYEVVINKTIPATHKESLELYRELKQIGYRLKVTTHKNLTTSNHAVKKSDISLLYKGDKEKINNHLQKTRDLIKT